MVEYTTWTEIGHEVYQDMGGTYTNRESAQSVTSTLAEFWNQNTDRLRQASEAEARRIARQNMNV
jgi:hypothetical protein